MNADGVPARLIVAYRNGAPVRLEQVANVIDSVEDNEQRAWLYTKNGERSARSSLSVHEAARQQHHRGDRRGPRAAAGVRAQLPPSVHLSIRGDRSKTIREAFKDIQMTMLVTLVLVVVRHLPVPAQRLGDADSRAGAAVLDPRHLRRDAAAELQPQQPVDDGADPLASASSSTTRS